MHAPEPSGQILARVCSDPGETPRGAREVLCHRRQPEREQHRLRRLPMRRRGHRRFVGERGCRARDGAARDARAYSRALRGARAGVEQQGGRDLIVAAAAGVQPAARLGLEFAHASVDRAVDVFRAATARGGGERPGCDLGCDPVERDFQRYGSAGVDDAAVAQRRDVRARAGNVERREHQVVLERRPKRQERRVGGALKRPPHWSALPFNGRRIARRGRRAPPARAATPRVR